MGLVVAVVFFLDMVIPSFFSLVLVLVLVVALMLVVVFFLDIVIPLSSVELSVSAHAVISLRTFTVETDSPCPSYDMGKSEHIAEYTETGPKSKQR